MDLASVSPLIAGILAGTVSTVSLLPLDNIKVRLQVNDGNRKNNNPKRTRFASFRLLRGVIRHEGIQGLYQGLSPAVVGSAVSWGGFFFVYESFKKALRTRKNDSHNGNSTSFSSLENFQLACASGAVMVFLTNPVWLIKLRMQLQMKRTSERLQGTHKPYKGLTHAARTIIKEEGKVAWYFDQYCCCKLRLLMFFCNIYKDFGPFIKGQGLHYC